MTDRVLVLRKMDDKNPESTKGLVDPRLFTGGNRLKAIKDPQNNLWTVKYEAGAVPEPLKQRWTDFSKLLAFVEQYFAKRNVKVEKVID